MAVLNRCLLPLVLLQDGRSATWFIFPLAASFLSFLLKIRVEAVSVMVIHSWVAMVKSISPLLPPSATAECISLMRCLQPVCRAAAAAAAAAAPAAAVAVVC